MLGEFYVCVSLRGDKIAGRFELMEVGVERIVDVPFPI